MDNSGKRGFSASVKNTAGSPQYYQNIPEFSPCSTGGFAIRPRIPVASTGAYSDGWFRYLDGERWTTTSTNLNGDKELTISSLKYPYDGIVCEYRK